MGTQETIARGIVKAEGHYVLKVKKNQPTLMHDIKAFFDENSTHDTTDFFDTEPEKNHGRERVSGILHFIPHGLYIRQKEMGHS